MNDFADTVLYLAIALLSVLPAVYAIALQTLVSAVEHEKRTSAAAVARFEQQIGAYKEAALDPNQRHEALDDLQKRIEGVRVDLARTSTEAQLVSAKHAFLLPAIAWLGAISLGSIAKFFAPLAAHKAWLVTAAALAVVAGLWQLYRVLQAAQKFERAKAPDLRVSVRGGPGTLQWKNGVHAALFVSVYNAAPRTAKALQLEITVPKPFYWFGNRPWFEPGSNVGVIHTVAFDLKAYNTYGYELQVDPKLAGQYELHIRAISDDFYGDGLRQKVLVS